MLAARPHDVAGAAYARLYEPGSSDYGRFLSSGEFTALIGPSARLVDQFRVELAQRGMSADWQAGNHWIVVQGHAVTRERLQDAANEAGLPVSAAVALDSQAVVSADFVPVGGLTPAHLARAYNIAPLHGMGIDGTGETVVVVVPEDGYRQAALDVFTDRHGLPPISVTDGWDDSAAIEPIGELEMDLEVIHAIAPGARLVVFASQDGRFGPMLRMLGAAVAQYPGAIVSQSFSNCEATWGLILARQVEALYQRAALQGQSVFSSSGDNGAFGCLDEGDVPGEEAVGVRLPASAPYVTAVGGTYLSVRTDGGYRNEAAWNGPALTEGSGGGFSLYYPIPDWQEGPGVRTELSNGQRQVPDVAADAGGGMSIHLSGHGWVTGGGTSQAVPIWAGITALVNQYLKRQGLPPLGFANPALYSVAESHPDAFHDITIGTNLLYPTASGYDMATGLGSPNVWQLAQALAEYQRAGAMTGSAGGG